MARSFWLLYACVAFLTSLRAAYGMHQVKDRFLRESREGAEGIFYVTMFVSAVAMGLCWFLYWPALGAVALSDRVREEVDDDENDEE